LEIFLKLAFHFYWSENAKRIKMEIRKATRKDGAIILELSSKLALYEKKRPEEIALTLDKIDAHCFGEHAFFKVLLADINEQPVGFALYFFSYSGYIGAPVLYLEDLFVEEPFRQRGVGKALLSKLAKIAIESKCCRMEWHAFTWNHPALEFYKKLGAVAKEDLRQFRLVGNSLEQLASGQAIKDCT